MRLVILAAAATFGLLAACSSHGGESASDDQTPTNPPDRAADPNGAAPAPLAPPADPPPSSLGSGTTADPDGGAAEGGPSTSTNTGTPGGGSLCENNSVRETEVNDTADTANPVPAATGSFCGSLSSANDVDFMTFTMPANVSYLAFGSSFTHAGLSIVFTANGKSFKVGEQPVFEPGQKYVAKISTTGGQALDYKLDIQIKQ